MKMNYIYVDNKEKYDQMCEWLAGVSYFVFDTETGPKPEYREEWDENPKIGLDPYRSQIYTYQVGTKSVQYILDVRYGFDVKPILDALENPKQTVVGQNLRFDYKFIMLEHGIKPTNQMDCQLMEQVIRNGLFPTKGGEQGLGITRKMTSMGALAKRYLDIEIDKDKEMRMGLFKTPKGGFTEAQLEYMAGDCVYPDLIARMQVKLIQDRGLRTTVDLEHQLIPVIANMEIVGIPFDATTWMSLYQEACSDRIILEKKLEKILDVEAPQQEDLFGKPQKKRLVNLSSSVQVAKLLARKGIHGFMDENGKPLSTNTPKIILGRIQGTIPAEVADTLVEFRQLEQKISSYGLNFVKSVHPITKRIHPDFTQCVLVTGRMSASPGVQTIPRDKRYRACFVAPEGYTFIILDASQIEARISVDLTKDKAGIETFSRYDCDIYKEDGERFYGRPIDRSTEEGEMLRQRAKNAWLGLLYGQWKKKFHTWSIVALGEDIPQEETDFLFDKFFEVHTEIKQVMDGWSALGNFFESNRYIIENDIHRFVKKENVYNNIYEHTMERENDEDLAEIRAKYRSENMEKICYAESVIGRKRFFRPDYTNTYTAARNAPIQSTAADIQKATMLAYQKHHWENNYDANLVLVVHDELVTLVREDQAEKLYEEQLKIGEEVGQMFFDNVRMKLEGGISKHWKKM